VMNPLFYNNQLKVNLLPFSLFFPPPSPLLSSISSPPFSFFYYFFQSCFFVFLDLSRSFSLSLFGSLSHFRSFALSFLACSFLLRAFSLLLLVPFLIVLQFFLFVPSLSDFFSRHFGADFLGGHDRKWEEIGRRPERSRWSPTKCP
jgi:hypothetical protein